MKDEKIERLIREGYSDDQIIRIIENDSIRKKAIGLIATALSYFGIDGPGALLKAEEILKDLPDISESQITVSSNIDW